MSRKKKRGVPTLYSESKVKVGVSLTPTGAKRLGDIARELGLSRSEFVERIARGQFDVSGSGNETTITLETNTEAKTVNLAVSSDENSVAPQVESSVSHPSENQDTTAFVQLQERYQTLQRQSDEQANTINNLEQQLAKCSKLEAQLAKTVPTEDYQQLQKQLEQLLQQQEVTVSELRHQLEHQNVSMADLEHQLARIPQLETQLANSIASVTKQLNSGVSLEHSPSPVQIHQQPQPISHQSNTNVGLTDSSESYGALKQKIEEQEKTINNLRQEMSDLRRLATIAESHLGRWRHNTFSH